MNSDGLGCQKKVGNFDLNLSDALQNRHKVSSKRVIMLMWCRKTLMCLDLSLSHILVNQGNNEMLVYS